MTTTMPARTRHAGRPVPAPLPGPALLEAEQRLIFDRTWQLAGHVGSLPQTRQLHHRRAGSQPVLVVRDEDGVLRAYRNVCRHRGSRLLSGSGQCKAAIRCRYHGWTYKLDGQMIGAPEALAYGKRLDKSSLGLLPARVEELSGLVFVNLDLDATPLTELRRRPARAGSSATGSRRCSHSRRTRAISRRTGRWSPTTTWRATTSRSRTPA